MEDLLKTHFDKYDFDIRKKSQGYSRFMDQKITPDVLSFIADCIVNFLGGKDPSTNFTIGDIWKFPYFVKNAVAVFGKPSPGNITAKSEYDKFIAQPLKTLAFSKILKEKKVGRKNTYTVLNPDVLEYISQNERNAWRFLVDYVKKVLTDSGFIRKFEAYKVKGLANTLTKEDFGTLKTEFQAFMRGYTEINTNREINRIFPKILNPYSAKYQIPGTEAGRMTSGRFIYPDLMYNRKNFRDIGKDKTLTRREDIREISEKPEVVIYRVQKAKNIIKRYHTSSEVRDSLAVGASRDVHHIFSEHEFPEISDYLENLILLTPQQHFTRAHPKESTQIINHEYQKECLLSKIDSIVTSTKRSENLYSKERFIHILNIGFGLELPTTTTFEDIKKLIIARKVN